MTKPTAVECNAAFAVIERAETHLLALMQAVGIPGAGVSVWHGDYGQPDVSLRSNKRVFMNTSQGKRNLESTRTNYNNAEKMIAEVGEHLKAKAVA